MKRILNQQAIREMNFWDRFLWWITGELSEKYFITVDEDEGTNYYIPGGCDIQAFICDKPEKSCALAFKRAALSGKPFSIVGISLSKDRATIIKPLFINETPLCQELKEVEESGKIIVLLTSPNTEDQILVAALENIKILNYNYTVAVDDLITEEIVDVFCELHPWQHAQKEMSFPKMQENIFYQRQ